MNERQMCRKCFCLGYDLVPVNGEWSCLEHLSGHEAGAEIVRLSEQLAELTDRITKTESSLDQYMQMFDHALDCVNEVFQECSDNPNPILKDYAKLGADKFEEVKRLACDYKMALERLAEAEAAFKRMLEQCDKANLHRDELHKHITELETAVLNFLRDSSWARYGREADAVEMRFNHKDYKVQCGLIPFDELAKALVKSNPTLSDWRERCLRDE